MQLRIRLYATMAVIVGGVLFAGNVTTAEWTAPVCLAEFNDHENGFTGGQPCISSDGLSIFFLRQVPSPDSNRRYQLFEAVRDDLSDVFAPARALSELNPMSGHINNPWISADGLRLLLRTCGWQQWASRTISKNGRSCFYPRALGTGENFPRNPHHQPC